MAKDFRSKQIRTSKLIGSGGIAEGTPYLGLAIYDHRHAVNSGGAQKYDGTLQPSMLNNVGKDVWMFVSGSRAYPQFTWPGGGAGGSSTSAEWLGRNLVGSAIGEPAYQGGKVVLFGGDVVISGTLYADRQVVEVDETVRGDLLVPNHAHISGSTTVNRGAVFNLSSGSTDYTTIAGVGNPGNDFVVHGSLTGSLLHIDASANRIGIGDASPESFVNIKFLTNDALTAVSASANYHLRLEGSQTTNKGTGLAFGADDKVGASIIFKDKGAHSQGELQFYTKDSTTAAGSVEQRLVITNDGKVGIGENGQSYGFDPDALLEIYGTTTQLKLSNNAADYSTLGVGTNGDLTITTVDAAGSAANFVVAADGAVDIDANAGALALDGSTAINIGTEADVPIDINSSTLDIDASGAITIDSTSTIVLSGDGGATIGDDTEALAYDGSGNVDFDAVALDIDASSTIHISGSNVTAIAGSGPLTLQAVNGAVNIDADGGYLYLDGSTGISIGTEADAPIDIDSSTLDIDASGNVTIDTAGTLSIDATGGVSNITSTTDAASEDFTISLAGATDSSLILSSTGTGADALQVSTSAGGMDITVAGAAAGEDLDISSNTSINLTASEDASDAIKLSSSAGGVDITAGGGAGQDIDVTNTAGSINLNAGEADANAITINASNAAGGINVDAGTAGIAVDTTGAISLDSTYNNAAAINITTNAGTSEKIVIQNTQGNTEAAAADGAIKLDASAGGISLDAALDIHLAADGGDIAFSDGTTTVMNFDVDNVAFKMMDDADTGDYFQIAVAQHGATTLTTVDDDAANADLTLTIDGDITAAAQGVVSIDANAGAVTINGSGGINIGTDADVAIDIDSSTLDIDASGAITMDSTSTIVISGDAGATLSDDTEGLSYDGSGNVDFDAVALDIDASGAITIDGTSTFSVDAVGASNVTTRGVLTVSGSTGMNLHADSGEIDITAASGSLDINSAGAITIDGSSTISIDGGGALNIDTSSGVLSVGTANSGIAVNIGHSTSEVTVGDNLTVQGNLTVNGTTTTVNSTTVTVDDPIFTLGGDTNAATDDNKDRGIEFKWHNGSAAKRGFFGFDDSTGDFAFIPDAINSNEVFSGEAGSIRAQAIKFADDGSLYGDAGNLRFTVPAGGDVHLSSSIGMVFGNSGEKIEGDGTGISVKGGYVHLDSEDHVTLDVGADGDKIDFKADGNVRLRGWVYSNRFVWHPQQNDFDIVYNGLTGGSTTEIGRWDSSASSLLMASSKPIQFGDAGESIVGDGTDLAVSSSNDLLFDVARNILLDAGGNTFDFMAGGSSKLLLTHSNSGDMTFETQTSNKDMIFKVNDGGTKTEVFRLDGDVSSLRLAPGKQLHFGDAGEALVGDGTDLAISASNHFTVDAAGDIVLDSDAGSWEFKDGGVNLFAIENSSSDVVLQPKVANKDIIFKEDGGTEIARFDSSAESLLMASSKKVMLGAPEEYLYGDGTDLHIGVGAGGDINIPSAIGLTFGNDGEKIEGDGTDLFVNSSAILYLSASSDIKIPASIDLILGRDSEKITGDGTDLSIASAGNLNLTSTVNEANAIYVRANGGTAETIKIHADQSEAVAANAAAIQLTSDAGAIGLTANGGTIGVQGNGTGGNPAFRFASDASSMYVDIKGEFHVDAGLYSGAAGWNMWGTAASSLNTSSGAITIDGENGVTIKENGTAIISIDDDRDVAIGDSAGGGSYGDPDVLLNGFVKFNGYDGVATYGGDVILNEVGGNYDFRVETNNATHALVVDGGLDSVIMGTNTTYNNLPRATLHIRQDDNGSAAPDGKNTSILIEHHNATLSSSIIFGEYSTSAHTTTRLAEIISDKDHNLVLSASKQDKDIIFKVNDGGSELEIARVDGSAGSLLMATGKKIEMGSANVSMVNTSQNELVITSSLMGVDTEEAYFSGDVFVSGTLTPVGLSLSNLDLNANSYIRFGDSNNYIQRVSNDLVFRDDVVGTTKTLADLSSIGAVGNAFEILPTQSPATLKIRTTGSFSVDGNNQYAETAGADLFFYVSGTIDRGSTSDTKTAAFGGDVTTSGSFKAGAIYDSWGAKPGTVSYALSASMEEVGYQAPLVGKNGAGSDVFSILPGYDLNKASNASVVTFLGEVSDGNIIFGVNDGGTATEVFRLQGNNASMRMAANKNLEFGGTSRYVSSPNTTVINYVNSNAGGGHQFTGHIYPAANNTYDLGTESSRFRNIYTGDLNLKNERGDWTIVEEADYLCVINNTTGKKFKMMLEPIEENE